MSSALLRIGLGFSTVRRSVRGLCLLKDHFAPPTYAGSQGFATSTKARDEKDKLKKFTIEDENEILSKLISNFAEEEKAGDVVPVFKKALLYGHKAALKDEFGEYSYIKLYTAAKKLAFQISNFCGSGANQRVAFLCPNDAIYLIVQWACWISGQVAVPLSPRHPSELLKYFITDSKAHLVITTPEYEPTLQPIATNLEKILIVIDHSFIPEIDPQISWLDPKAENVLQLCQQLVIESALSSNFYTKSNAMILYTSGTTGSPKGVVLSHKNISSQINCLTDAWQYSNKDCLLHVLPLNHVHGCVNALLCPLSVGAKIVMHDRFDSHNVWSTLLGINTPAKDRVNMFMAVPTIYNFLIDEYDKIFAKNSRMVEYIENHCKKNIRLMVSGSAPLPASVFERWFEISGHRLLERYGMTEIGMALSNPYIEDKNRVRKPGTVGQPLPGVEVRIVDNEGKTLHQCKGESGKGFWCTVDKPFYESTTPKKSSAPIVGELQVKGPNVFKEYFNRPEETKREFEMDFFKTGDVTSYDGESFKILGRSSVDIIKTGGYKVSALEVETQLLNHPSIKDAAVVGLEDITWGQKVAAVAVLKDGAALDLESLRVFCSEKLPTYSMPSVLMIVNEMPRNAMGKVNKKDILNLWSVEAEASKNKVENTEDVAEVNITPETDSKTK